MKGLPRSLAHANLGMSKNIPISLAVVTTGMTGVGFGTAVISGLPEGNILLLGAVAYIAITKGSADTVDAFDGDYAIGSAPSTSNAALATTKADIIPSTALGAATGGTSPLVRGANATQAILDNTDGSLELNFNLLIDDASVSADDQDFTVRGVVTLAYIVLGDD